MSDNIVLGKATVEGDTGRQLVDLLEEIKERLPALSAKEEVDFSLICEKDDNFLHWREIVQSKPSEPSNRKKAAASISSVEPDQRKWVSFKYKYSSPFSTAKFKDKETKEIWRRRMDDCLGEAWKIPDDGRISLSFIHQTMFEDSDDGEYLVPKQLSFPWCHEKCTGYLGTKADSCMQKDAMGDENRDRLIRKRILYMRDVDAISESTRTFLLHKRLLHLKDFGQKQKNGLAFFVVDKDPCTGKEAHYYLRRAPKVVDGLGTGIKKFQTVLNKQYASKISNQAPWKRLILNQGLAALPPDIWDGHSPAESRPVYPYFTSNSDSNAHQLTWVDLMSQHLKLYVKLERRAWNRSANPYSDHLYRNGFHITFFELVKDPTHDPSQSQWPTGRLLSNDIGSPAAGVTFQESAFTMLMQLPHHMSSSPQQNTFIPHPFFTVVILAPKLFWNPPEEKWSSQGASSILRNSSAEIAEVDVIRIALGRVVERWIELNAYLESLLAEKFMIPEDYVKLLFDDENFTRSRKYFWAIGCLSEFITSITDNKAQWDLYRAARVDPILQLNNAAALFNAAKIKNINEDDPWNTENESENYEFERYRSIVFKAQVFADTLADIKVQFESKLEQVKALRDGLFNASALVESRASTRLGENVKLLTYVSIFYLPLAFCASIWAIPNIFNSKTTSAFIGTAIAVGIATYAIVLNIDTIAHKLQAHYSTRKRKRIQQMQREPREDWQKLGARFEEFKPAIEKQVPSEWWILVFVLRKLPFYMRALWGRITGPGSYRMNSKVESVVREGPTLTQEHDVASPGITSNSTISQTSQNSQIPLMTGGNGNLEGNSAAQVLESKFFGGFKDKFRMREIMGNGGSKTKVEESKLEFV